MNFAVNRTGAGTDQLVGMRGSARTRRIHSCTTVWPLAAREENMTSLGERTVAKLQSMDAALWTDLDKFVYGCLVENTVTLDECVVKMRECESNVDRFTYAYCAVHCTRHVENPNVDVVLARLLVAAVLTRTAAETL